MFKKISDFFSNFWGAIVAIFGVIFGIFFFIRKHEDEEIRKAKDRIKNRSGKQEALDSIINSNGDAIENLEGEQENIEKALSEIEESGKEEKIEDFFNKRGF